MATILQQLLSASLLTSRPAVAKGEKNVAAAETSAAMPSTIAPLEFNDEEDEEAEMEEEEDDEPSSSPKGDNDDDDDDEGPSMLKTRKTS